MQPSDRYIPFSKLPKSPAGYAAFAELKRNLSDEEWLAVCRLMCLSDLYFAVRFVFLTRTAPRIADGSQFVFDRCREIQESPNGNIDIWAREHYKSTLITYALTLWDVLRNPERTFGIFSHTKNIARDFLAQIRKEFEENELLKACFPDVCFKDPRRESDDWTASSITVKRKGNPRESTIEAHGLIDGQPIGKHFHTRVYDDVVTKESVNTPEQIQKTTENWELSLSLGKEGGAERYIGTRYHANDTYATIMSREYAEPRIYPAVEFDDDGEPDMAAPVLYTPEYIAEKRKGSAGSTFASQWLCDPLADNVAGFKREWVKYYKNDAFTVGQRTNNYILVDPAHSKRRESDYSAFWVVGLGADRNYYVLDIVRDRLNLSQRWDVLLELHQMWEPVEVRYEQYGMMADVEFMEHQMEVFNYRFDIVEVRGNTKKEDRIRRLVPHFEQGRFFLPRSMERRNSEGELQDLIEIFLNEEFCNFPISSHDDMLDALSRIAEPDHPLMWPQGRSRRKDWAEDHNMFDAVPPGDLDWMYA